ncbi:triose-phosphate isomerase [Psychrobacter sp. AH5]|uniref:triose-phosphate isomerase n=1 Tax=Psychrobacter sp. AH5 TaxID=2937433 RepID=UPI00333EB2EE
MQAWVIGNWKQNPATKREVETLVTEIVTANNERSVNNSNTDSSHDKAKTCQLMLAPSCIHLSAVSSRLQDSSILCAAQDISAHSATVGAYTGDCSAQQVADAGATWTILGHSERRQYHQESNEILLAKLVCALEQKLGAVLCIGETQAQYDARDTIKVIDEQLQVVKQLLAQPIAKSMDLDHTLAEQLIIAYEPVWAIGTGKVPTVSEVSATHKHIKEQLASFASKLPAITVLYGGSVNADNADSFAASPVIDGALVGGASLKAESFLAIAKAFS